MCWCALRVVVRKKVRWVTPISIQFQTKQPFFPLHVSALNGSPSYVSVHAFLPIDELSFRGLRRLGHPEFNERERLFYPKDMLRCRQAFPSLRDQAYSLVSFRGEVDTDEMRDLWLATTEEQRAAVQAEVDWTAARKTRHRSEEEILDGLFGFLADHPRTKWADEARRMVEARGGGDPVQSARRHLTLAREEADAIRYRDAILGCRRVARIAPSLADAAEALEAEFIAAERAEVERRWAQLERLKSEALKSRDARAYFRELVTLLALCKDVHPEKELFTEKLKATYYQKGREEMSWLERHHAHRLNRRLWDTYEGLDWNVRRNPEVAYRDCQLLVALTDKSAVGKKAAEYSRYMRRGLRNP